MTEAYTYPTPAQQAEVNDIIDQAMTPTPLGEFACGSVALFNHGVRVVKELEAIKGYVPHKFESPHYNGADEYISQGRQVIFDAVEQIPGFELDKHALTGRKDRHSEGRQQLNDVLDQQIQQLPEDSRAVAANLTHHTTFAIINTATGMNRATYRSRRDVVTARLAQPRWQLIRKVTNGQLGQQDLQGLRTDVESVDRTAILPDFYGLKPEQQKEIVNALGRDALTVCAFAARHGITQQLVRLRPQVLLRPAHELLKMQQTLRDPSAALQQYFSMPTDIGGAAHSLMPVTNLKPGESIRVSRSLLTAERLGLSVQEVFLAAGLQLYQRFGDFYTMPRIDAREWAEADPVKKLAQNYFGNFRQAVIQAAPMHRERAEAVIPAYGHHATPEKLVRRYFVTALAKHNGLQPLPRAVETFVYVRRSPQGTRARVSLATGSLIEGTQFVNEIIKRRKVTAELSNERGMLKPIIRR